MRGDQSFRMALSLGRVGAWGRGEGGAGVRAGMEVGVSGSRTAKELEQKRKRKEVEERGGWKEGQGREVGDWGGKKSTWLESEGQRHGEERG